MKKFEHDFVLSVTKSDELKKRHEISYNINGNNSELRNIPLEVAELIYNNYPNMFTELSPVKAFSDINPKDIAIKLNEDSNELFVSNYYAKSKEALLILVTELHDYYQRKLTPNNVDFNSQVLNRDELYGLVINKIVEQMNLDKTTEEWITSNKLILKNRINQSDDKDCVITDLLNELDNTLNPFAQNIENMKNPEEYKDEIELNFSFVGDYKALFIKDIDTGTIINCYTDGKNIGYGIRFSNISKSYNLRHTIECKSEYTHDGTEHLSIVEFNDDNSKKAKDIFYNITENTLSDKPETAQDRVTKKVSDIQKEKTIVILTSAILLASLITKSSMIKEKGMNLRRESN